MDSDNPYEAPAVDPILTTQAANDEIQLATLGDRFLGAFIDGLVGFAVMIPVWGAMFGLGVVKSMADMGNIGQGYTVLIGIIQYAAMMAVQWKFLAATGQTIGKKVAKTRIARMDGSKPTMLDLVIKRYGFVSLISLIPVAGIYLPLVDVLLIFGKKRRCLHDLVAGTQVLSLRPVA